MKYPTRNGLIIPPTELYLPPTELQLNTKHATNNHHGYFERGSYANGPRWRSMFRSLVTNVYPMLVTDHIELHNEFDAPKMPKDYQMIDTLDEYAFNNGAIDLVREKKTNSTYQVPLEQWERIRDGKT